MAGAEIGIALFSPDKHDGPLIYDGGEGMEHFMERIRKRINGLPKVFYSHDGKSCYISEQKKYLTIGFIVTTPPASKSHTDLLQRLVTRFISLLEFFCGPLDEDVVGGRSGLVIEIGQILTRMGLMSALQLSNGELVNYIRKNLSVKAKPNVSGVRIEISEIVNFLWTDGQCKCLVKGTITVHNALANDLVMECHSSVQLRAGEHVPCKSLGSGSVKIPIELGSYTLCTYQSVKCPFEFQKGDKSISIIWNSSSLDETSAKLDYCRMRMGWRSSDRSPRFTLDPPTLAHAASYDSHTRTIIWEFYHLVGATRYKLDFVDGMDVEGGSMEFVIGGCLLSATGLGDIKVYQESTGISAERQMHLTRHSSSSPKFNLIKL